MTKTCQRALMTSMRYSTDQQAGHEAPLFFKVDRVTWFDTVFRKVLKYLINIGTFWKTMSNYVTLSTLSTLMAKKHSGRKTCTRLMT